MYRGGGPITEYDMQNKISPILAAAGLALFLATAVNAQSPVRVRGTIERVDGPTLW